MKATSGIEVGGELCAPLLSPHRVPSPVELAQIGMRLRLSDEPIHLRADVEDLHSQWLCRVRGCGQTRPWRAMHRWCKGLGEGGASGGRWRPRICAQATGAVWWTSTAVGGPRSRHARPTHIRQPQHERAARRRVLSLTAPGVPGRRLRPCHCAQRSDEHRRRAVISARVRPNPTQATSSARARLSRAPDSIALSPPPPRTRTSHHGRSEEVDTLLVSTADADLARYTHLHRQARGGTGERRLVACSSRAHWPSHRCCLVCSPDTARGAFRTHRERALRRRRPRSHLDPRALPVC